MSQNPTTIDWPKLLDDIAWLMGEGDFAFEQVRKPLSTYELADHLKVPRGTLRGWMDGSEPKHCDGERVLLEWCRLTSKAREFAPLQKRMLTAATMRERR